MGVFPSFLKEENKYNEKKDAPHYLMAKGVQNKASGKKQLRDNHVKCVSICMCLVHFLGNHS